LTGGAERTTQKRSEKGRGRRLSEQANSGGKPHPPPKHRTLEGNLATSKKGETRRNCSRSAAEESKGGEGNGIVVGRRKQKRLRVGKSVKRRRARGKASAQEEKLAKSVRRSTAEGKEEEMTEKEGGDEGRGQQLERWRRAP